MAKCTITGIFLISKSVKRWFVAKKERRPEFGTTLSTIILFEFNPFSTLHHHAADRNFSIHRHAKEVSSLCQTAKIKGSA